MGDIFTYQNVATSRGLDDDNQSSSGNPVITSTFSNTTYNQQWDTEPWNSTYYSLGSDDGLFLDGTNSPPTTTSYNASNLGQYWIITYGGGGTTLQCRDNSKYLSNVSGSTCSMVSTASPGNAQKWDMELAPNPGRRVGRVPGKPKAQANSPAKKSPGKKAASPAKASPKRGPTKTIAKKAAPKKSPVKKAAPKKVAAKKAAPKKAAPKRAAPKRAAPKKAAPKKAAKKTK